MKYVCLIVILLIFSCTKEKIIVKKKLTDLEILDSLKKYKNQKEPMNLFSYRIDEYNCLKYLNFEYCNLQRVPEEIFLLQELETLLIRNDKLDNFPKSFRKLGKLRTLGVRNCQLPDSINLELPKFLVDLHFSGNSIKSISFKNTNNLESLFLYENNLQLLDSSFCNLLNLEFLVIDENQLKDIDLRCLPKLKRVSAAKNPFLDTLEIRKKHPNVEFIFKYENE
jgi:Leucine-rich repeat (LRR) protein